MNTAYFNRTRDNEARKVVPAALVTYMTAAFVVIPSVVSGIAMGFIHL